MSWQAAMRVAGAGVALAALTAGCAAAPQVLKAGPPPFPSAFGAPAASAHHHAAGRQGRTRQRVRVLRADPPARHAHRHRATGDAPIHRVPKPKRSQYPVHPGYRPMLGVFEPGVPRSYWPVEHFGQLVHRQPKLVLFYSGFGEQFRSSFAQTVYEHGGIPLDQINPLGVSIAKIASGGYDAYLRSLADQVRRFGHRVIIGFGHEMNGSWFPWGWTHVPASTFVRAWRRVVDVFRAQGATNVTWMWTISRVLDQGPVQPYWPGASYVNWVGIDGYYTSPGDRFTNVFLRMLSVVHRFTHDPVLISESAIGQRAGQAKMIPNLLSGVIRYGFLGLVWFDKDQHGGLSKQDWRLEGHPNALAKFRYGMRYYS
jgi:mannan endo-1,4-beta-mannosidase